MTVLDNIKLGRHCHLKTGAARRALLHAGARREEEELRARDRGADHRFPRDRPHPQGAGRLARLRPAEAGGAGARAGDAAAAAAARRAGRRHEPRGDRGHGALHPRGAARMGRDRADGRARHGHGDGPLRPRGGAELRPGHRPRPAGRGAGRPARWSSAYLGSGDVARAARAVPRRRRAAAPRARPPEAMDGWLLFEIVLAGVGTGGLYALTGLAFVLIYKATRVVNIAIGEMLMIGAYLFFAFAAGMGLPVWLAIPAALLGLGGVRRAGRAHRDPADARRIADLLVHGHGRPRLGAGRPGRAGVDGRPAAAARVPAAKPSPSARRWCRRRSSTASGSRCC